MTRFDRGGSECLQHGQGAVDLGALRCPGLLCLQLRNSRPQAVDLAEAGECRRLRGCAGRSHEMDEDRRKGAARFCATPSGGGGALAGVAQGCRRPTSSHSTRSTATTEAHHPLETGQCCNHRRWRRCSRSGRRSHASNPGRCRRHAGTFRCPGEDVLTDSCSGSRRRPSGSITEYATIVAGIRAIHTVSVCRTTIKDSWVRYL